MSNLNKKVDEYINGLRRRVLLDVGAGVCLSILSIVFLSWLYLPPLGEVKEVEGVITDFILVPSDEGDKSYMFVRLKNGIKVKVKVLQNKRLKKGMAIILQEQKALAFGSTTYRLIIGK